MDHVLDRAHGVGGALAVETEPYVPARASGGNDIPSNKAAGRKIFVHIPRLLNSSGRNARAGAKLFTDRLAKFNPRAE
jgi:hypothetical protein